MQNKEVCRLVLWLGRTGFPLALELKQGQPVFGMNWSLHFQLCCRRLSKVLQWGFTHNPAGSLQAARWLCFASVVWPWRSEKVVSMLCEVLGVNATSCSYCKPDRRPKVLGWGVKGRMHTATPQEYLFCQILVTKSCEMLRQSNISMLPTGWTHFKSCDAASSVTLLMLSVWSQFSCISWQKPGVWWVHPVVSDLNPLISQLRAISSLSKGPELCLGMGGQYGKVREHLPFWQWAATSALPYCRTKTLFTAVRHITLLPGAAS